MNQMDSIRNGFHSIEQVADTFLKKNVRESGESTEVSFDEVLRAKQDAINPLRFSKHAANRLNDRNISLSADQSNGSRTAYLKPVKRELTNHWCLWIRSHLS